MSSLTISDRSVVPSRDVAPAVGLAPESRQMLLRRDLRASLGDGAGYGGMVGFGETYFSAFALAVGLGELMAGLVASLPLLAGGILQTISPLAIRWLGSHKRWVVCCATTQSLTFVPLIVAACRGHLSEAGLLWIAAVYWAAGLATGPAWNTWIGTIVPCAHACGVLRISYACLPGGIVSGFPVGRNRVAVRLGESPRAQHICRPVRDRRVLAPVFRVDADAHHGTDAHSRKDASPGLARAPTSTGGG